MCLVVKCCFTTGTGDPPSKILIDGVPVEGVEEFIYLGSKQSSNALPTGCSTQDWTWLFSDEFCAEGMELQFSQYQHQSTPVPSTDKVFSALT